ncbi:hypothetical protein [Nocardioides marmoraquaticus]
MAFKFIITDAELLLSYIRALLWPAVVLVTVFTFREPIQRKFAQLLRVEGLGGAVEFGPQQLEDDLRRDVEQLTSLDEEDVQADVTDADTAALEQPAVTSEPPVEREEEPQRVVAGKGAPRPPLRLQQELSDQHVEDLVDLAIAAGTPREAEAWRQKLLSEPQLGRRLVMKSLRGSLRSADRRAASTRDSIESIVQKSAAWGYDVGASGSEPLVPDIQWNDDGSWHITTAVPKAVRSAPSRSRSDQDDLRDLVNPRRHVERLEREIIAMEKKATSPLGGLTAASLSETRYLEELKSRLSTIDPGNPFGRGF